MNPILKKRLYLLEYALLPGRIIYKIESSNPHDYFAAKHSYTQFTIENGHPHLYSLTANGS
jgi:hypothetical protein